MDKGNQYTTEYCKASQTEPRSSKRPEDEAAAHRVFNTFELLEHILLELEPEQILDLRTVNKYWKEVVNGPSTSVKLKRHLFLKAIPTRPLWMSTRKNHAVKATIKKYGGENLGVFEYKATPAALNSFLSQRWTGCGESEENDSLSFHEDVKFREPIALEAIDSIYGAMFVCQPPATTVKLRWLTSLDHIKDSLNTRPRSVANEGGVRVRDILNCLCASLDNTKESFFGNYIFLALGCFLTPCERVFESVEKFEEAHRKSG